MARETLGEIALNRQDNEKDVPFFTPQSEDISDGEESVHPALKDAASILCEGQEAMWVEDDVNKMFQRASSKEKSIAKKKNKFNLFRGKRKTNQKAVVLLPPQPVNKEDVENQDTQLAPEDQETIIDDLNGTQGTSRGENNDIRDQGEDKTKENMNDADKPELVVGLESNKKEKEDDVEDVVHGSIDIPDEVLEEMKLQIEDAVERARKDLDSEDDSSESQFSSLGLTTDSLDFGEEYGVEMNIPSSGKAVELVGTGPMMLEAETIEQIDEAEEEPKGKKAKWGLLRIFKSKPKQQKVSPSSSKYTDPGEIAIAEQAADNSPDPEVSEPKQFSQNPPHSCNHEPDRYSVAAPKAALADDMEDSDTLSDDEEDALDSVYQSEEDEDENFDDRYRIGPPKMSKLEISDDASAVSEEQETIPNRVEDEKPALSIQIDCQEETTVASKAEESDENPEEPPIVDETLELGEKIDKTNDLKEQDGKTEMSLAELTKQDDETEKQKNRFAGIFSRRKNIKKSSKMTSSGKKTPKTKESPSFEPNADEVPQRQPSDSSKTTRDTSHAEPSPVASIKGDSMTVIANAVNKGARMAIESNLETEGTIKSRRIRTRADSSKDVIDLIRERTQNNNGKRQDPFDSSDAEIRKSMSKDPSGKAMFEPEREEKDAKSLMHLAPTPRANKSVEIEEEQPSEVSHQQQITQRLYGTPKGNGHLLTSKKVYIGDLLQHASTDPTVDSAVSDERETNEVLAAN